MPTAVLIDGAYFLRRFTHSFPNLDPNNDDDVSLAVIAMSAYHLAVRLGPKPTMMDIDAFSFHPEESEHLYRIFFYDCRPLTKRVHYPVSRKSLDLSKTPEAVARIAIHEKLNTARKVALRLGRLSDISDWQLKPDALKRLIDEPDQFNATDDDFILRVIQKGVDMRLGLDIASLAFKKQVDQIIMVTGDADFVPAAKLARREGIDVVLDPMWQSPAPDLAEHVDGIRNCRVDLKPRDKK